MTARITLAFTFWIQASFAAAATPLVVYIGGAKSTPQQMACWKTGAEREAHGKFEFKTYAYPQGVTLDHGSDKQPNGVALVEQIASELSKQDPARPVIIVGHSSGSDLANSLAVKVHQSGRSIAHLIDLDGYGVPASVSRDIPTTCVTAHGPDSSGADVHSLYWKDAHTECKGREVREMEFQGCDGSKFCLHFRMANKDAASSLKLDNYGGHGYDGCAANLDWLSSASPAKAGSTPTSTSVR